MWTDQISDVGTQERSVERRVEHQLGVVTGIDADERLLDDGRVVHVLVPSRDIERRRQLTNAVTVVEVNETWFRLIPNIKHLR